MIHLFCFTNYCLVKLFIMFPVLPTSPHIQGSDATYTPWGATSFNPNMMARGEQLKVSQEKELVLQESANSCPPGGRSVKSSMITRESCRI